MSSKKIDLLVSSVAKNLFVSSVKENLFVNPIEKDSYGGIVSNLNRKIVDLGLLKGQLAIPLSQNQSDLTNFQCCWFH